MTRVMYTFHPECQIKKWRIHIFAMTPMSVYEEQIAHQYSSFVSVFPAGNCYTP